MELRVRPAVSENGKRCTKQANRFSSRCAGKLFYNHEIVVSGAQNKGQLNNSERIQDFARSVLLNVNSETVQLYKIISCLSKCITQWIIYTHFWCDFDRASSLICGNKMPTRCNRGFYCSTQPPRHSTHLVTNLDNTRHLRLRTQIPQKLTKLFFTFLQHEIPQAATTV